MLAVCRFADADRGRRSSGAARSKDMAGAFYLSRRMLQSVDAGLPARATALHPIRKAIATNAGTVSAYRLTEQLKSLPDNPTRVR
jgi:hypothetical protein